MDTDTPRENGVKTMPRTFQEQKEWERIFRRQWLQSLSHMTIAEAAAFSGTGATLLKQQAERHNVFFKPASRVNKITAYEVAYIRKAILNGQSIYQISKTLKKHPQSISYQAKKMKIGTAYKMNGPRQKILEKCNAT